MRSPPCRRSDSDRTLRRRNSRLKDLIFHERSAKWAVTNPVVKEYCARFNIYWLLLVTSAGSALGASDSCRHTLFDNSFTPNSYFFSSVSAAGGSTLAYLKERRQLPVETKVFFTPPMLSDWNGNRNREAAGRQTSSWLTSTTATRNSPAPISLPNLHQAGLSSGEYSIRETRKMRATRAVLACLAANVVGHCPSCRKPDRLRPVLPRANPPRE